jgi:D-amino peptidase
MAGSEKGVLSHSFTPFIKNVWLNNSRIGEIGINMATFADLGIPAIFISGDEEAVWEARGIVPRIQGAVVKWGLEEKFRLGALTVRKATSLSPRKSCEVIKENAKAAMRKVGEIKPATFSKPYYLRVEYIEPQYADQAAQAPGVDRIDAFTTLQVREKTSDFAF